MSITHEEAQSILNSCLAKAEALGVVVAIAVVDDHAELVGLLRMSEPLYPFLPQAAQGKAMATVVWRGQPSGSLTERAGAPLMQAVNKVYGDKLFYQQGAVPIKRGEQVIGAVGVGGASPQQDEDIASTGAAAI